MSRILYFIAAVLLFVFVFALVIVAFKRHAKNTPAIAEATEAHPSALNEPIKHSARRAAKIVITSETTQITTGNSSIPSALSYSADFLSEARSFLDDLASQAEPNLAQLDAITSRILNDATLRREQRIGLFIDYLLAHSKTNTLATKYACDALDYLKPIERVNDVIAAFKATDDRTLQMELMEVLRFTGVLDDPNIDPSDLQTFKDNAPTIQAFFRDLLFSEDPDIAARALDGYCTVSPPDDAVYALDSISQAWIQKAATGKLTEGDLSHTHLLQQILDSAIANEDTQNSVIPMLPRLINAFPREALDTFDNFLYDVVSGANLTETAKATLSDYLTQTKPAPIPDSKYCHWLEAVASVNSAMGSAAEARYKFMADAIRKENDPMNVASVVIYADDGVLANLTIAEIDRYSAEFRTEAAAAGDGEDADYFNAAAEKLEEMSKAKE